MILQPPHWSADAGGTHWVHASQVCAAIGVRSTYASEFRRAASAGDNPVTSLHELGSPFLQPNATAVAPKDKSTRRDRALAFASDAIAVH
ncbi:MAG TPA: hypothetical protein VIM73_09080 [Polyangiaceae bacterium]